MHDNKRWRRCNIGLLAFVSLPRVVKHPKYQNELFSQIILMSQTAAGAMSTFRLGNGFALFIWTLHLLHLLLMTEWNPPISKRSVPSPLHHMQKDPKYENEPPCLHPLAAACCFLRGSYSAVKAGVGLNAALACVHWGRGLLWELGFLRQRSQPEVLCVSNEECSAPWDNNEGRAVLKINKLLELSIAAFIEK